MSDLTTMGDEELLRHMERESDLSRDPAATNYLSPSYKESRRTRDEILRRLSLARIDGKAVSCPSEASVWTARDEACLRGGGAD